MPRKRKKMVATGPLLDPIPFWVWIESVVGINGPNHKVQLTPAQRAIWKSVDRRVPMTEAESEAYRDLTGREPWIVGTPRPPFATLALGRGSGKTMLCGCLAMWEVLTSPYEAMPGEDVGVIVIAPRVSQAKRIIGYANGLTQLPLIAPFIETSIGGEIRIKGGRRIVVAAADQEGTAARGMTALALVIDEAAFLSPNEDQEIFESASSSGRGVSTFRSVLCSSVNGKSGLFWEIFNGNHGKNSEIWEVFLGPSSCVYPAVLDDPDALRKKIENPRAYVREYECDFEAGTDSEKVFDRGKLAAVIQAGVEAVKPVLGRRYLAAVDVSSMVNDNFVLTILERDSVNDTVSQCLLRVWNPQVDGGGSVQDIAEEIGEILKPFGIEEVHGDSYAKNWVGETFLTYGITYIPYTTNRQQKLARASLIKELINAGRIALLDNAIQTKEIWEYEKRTLPSGAVLVDKPESKGASDDCVDALGLGCECLIGHDVALHPPEQLEVSNPSKVLSLFVGSKYPNPWGKGPVLTFDEIASGGEGPRWVIQNWSRDWRYAQCSVGELAWLCGVGPVPLANHLGRDTVLQLTWMRWILAFWIRQRPRVEWIANLSAQFPAIPAWEGVQSRLVSHPDRVVTYEAQSQEGYRSGDLPRDWSPTGVRSRDTLIGVSTCPAERPWTTPAPQWGLGEVIEAHGGWWPSSPWAGEAEKVFAQGRRARKQTENLSPPPRAESYERSW